VPGARAARPGLAQTGVTRMVSGRLL